MFNFRSVAADRELAAMATSETLAPTVSAPAPAVSASAPAVSAPAPAVSAPAPTTSSSAPAVPAPLSALVSHQAPLTSVSAPQISRVERKVDIAKGKGKGKATDSAPGLSGLEHRNSVTNKLNNQLCKFWHSLSFKTMLIYILALFIGQHRQKFPFGTLTYHAAKNGFRIGLWPSLKVPRLPHNKIFVPGAITTQEWKTLDEWVTDGTLKLEAWSEGMYIFFFFE